MSDRWSDPEDSDGVPQVPYPVGDAPLDPEPGWVPNRDEFTRRLRVVRCPDRHPCRDLDTALLYGFAVGIVAGVALAVVLGA